MLTIFGLWRNRNKNILQCSFLVRSLTSETERVKWMCAILVLFVRVQKITNVFNGEQ